MMWRRNSWLLLTLVLLVSSVVFVNMAEAPETPTIFVDPPSISGDLDPSPGSVQTVTVSVSDIPSPGLWGYEFYMGLDEATFPPKKPITNMNFTTDVSGWTTTATVTRGVNTSGYDGNDGNPYGSGQGSYFVRANSSATQTALIDFYTEQTFTWALGTPISALLSFAYKISGNSITTNSVYMRIYSVNGTTNTVKSTLITSRYFSTAKPWTYNITSTSSTAFNLPGTYKLRLAVRLTAAATGTDKYVQVNWDDVGLKLSPVGVVEEPFLKAPPPVAPLTNMNFTTSASGWTTTTTVTTGTPTYGYSAADGNPSPGSGPGSYFVRADSTASDYARIEFITEQPFTWTQGTPLAAYLWYAYKVSGNSIPAIEQTRSPSDTAGTWTDPTNAYASDNQYATTSTDGAAQEYRNYGFGPVIPLDAIILKVEVGYEAYTAVDEYLNITISWNGGSSWATPERRFALPSSDPGVKWVDFTYATSWSVGLLSDAAFRTRVTSDANGPMSTVYLDSLPVRVTYILNLVSIRLIDPDNLPLYLVTEIAVIGQPWVYVQKLIVGESAFTKSGTYKFQLRTVLRTAAAGAGNYVQVNWDDVGLRLHQRAGGSTYFTAKYFEGSNRLYVISSLTGTPYVDSIPVVGGGALVTVKILVRYGWAVLDLYDTKLLTVGAPPSYPIIEMDHTATDGWFDNRIRGDSDSSTVVTIADMGEVSDRWTSPPGILPYARYVDWDDNGLITISDMGIVSDNWGRWVTLPDP